MPTKAVVLTRGQEVTAFVMMESGDTKAREMFVSLNQPLVASIAAKHSYKGLTWEGLMSAGNVGMLEAMKTFDHKRGLKFSTCAVPWITGAIKKAVREHAIEALGDKGQYTEQELETLQLEAVQREAEEEAESVDEGLEEHCEAVNTESDGEQLTPKEALADGQGAHAGNALQSRASTVYEQQDNNPAGMLGSEWYRTQLEEALPRLHDERLRLVVEMRYGWKPYNREHTLAEIGSRLFISPQRVAVLLQDAIECLKILVSDILV